MTNAPAGVADTTLVQSRAAGRAECADFAGAATAAGGLIAKVAAAQASKTTRFIRTSFNSLDHDDRLTLLDPGRPAASGNPRRKRLQARAELRIGNLAQAFAELLRHRPQLRADELRRRSGAFPCLKTIRLTAA